MSVIRPKPPEDPLAYDPAPLFASLGLSAAALAPLADGLDRARSASRDVPLVHLPDRLLADYNGTRTDGGAAGRTRATSELYAMLQAARRIRDSVDRVVVLGDPGCTQGARAVFACCCHPFHNELARGERGGRPRLAFVGHPFDGDSLQGLIDLVCPAGAARTDDLLDQWAIVVSEEGGGGATAATRLLMRLLLRSLADDRSRLGERVVPVAARGGSLAALAKAIGCPATFLLPEGVAGIRSVFTAAGLLPAAIAGVDVVRLLQGAAAMNRRYREAGPADNPVLQFVGASRLAARRCGVAPRLVSQQTDRLHDLVQWHDRLVAAAAGPSPADAGAAPVTRVFAGEPRRDPLAAVSLAPPASPPAREPDDVDRLLGAADEVTADATCAVPRVTAAFAARDGATLSLPRIDEHAIGQLVQLLLLAAVVEERLAE